MARKSCLHLSLLPSFYPHVFSRAINRLCVSLRNRDRGGQLQVCTRRAFGVSQRRQPERSSNRQIVKSTSPRQRDTQSGKWRSIIIRACSSERYVNPDLAVPVCERTRETYICIYICLWNRSCIYTHTHTRAPVDGRVYTRTRIVVQALAHEPPYTLKGGYIGFPVTTNLPRHRAIYISVESIAATKNQ